MEAEREDDTCNQTVQSQAQEYQPENHIGGDGNSGSETTGDSGSETTGDSGSETTGSPWVWRDVALGVAAGTAAVAATPVVLTAAGFTSGGIAVGSIAAGVQSTFYGGATSGVFATLQSAGMAGIGSTASAAIGGVIGTATVMAKRAWGRWFTSAEPADNQDN
ncbi:interferon alpha-inducible protein 27-like protein 1 isoform X1 [Montipora foliosa]|uniref:interferon alpha-inducible protein 27-like protein 1 isoform X1 n=1 Tax=Montipora foliosa TaxID=591990 RepID=UPI0035F19E64